MAIKVDLNKIDIDRQKIWLPYLSNKDRITRNYILRLKKEVFSHYSIECSLCKESNLAVLYLVDINKKRYGRAYGRAYVFLRKIKKQGYPQHYKVLCLNCLRKLYKDELPDDK